MQYSYLKAILSTNFRHAGIVNKHHEHGEIVVAQAEYYTRLETERLLVHAGEDY